MKLKMRRFFFFLLSCVVTMGLFFISGCEDEEIAELALLGTLSVAEINSTSAMVGGNVHYDGGVPVESKGVVWGTSGDPTLDENEGEKTVGDGIGQFVVSITGLSPATTYYVRGFAKNSEGIAYSPQLEFNTRGELVTVSTADVSDITVDSAVSGGNVEDDGGLEVVARGVVWSTEESPDLDDHEGMTEDGDGTGEFESELTGLSPSTTYYVRAYATNEEGTSYGEQESFTTESEPADLPVVVTASVSDITVDSAISGGSVEDDGGAGVTVRGVVWSTEESPGLDDHEGMTEDGDGTGEFESELTGLSPSTTYYVRAYATNEEGTSYGEQESFTTESEPVELPVVVTASVSDITVDSAISGGNVEDDGGADVTARGVVWSTSEDPDLENNKGFTEDGKGTGEYRSDITGLSPATTYYVRAYATNEVGTAYGDQLEFTTETEGELPTVTTRYISSITDQSATSGGDVTDDGSLFMVDRGIVWGLYEGVDVDKNEGMTNEGPGTGQFTSNMTGLAPGTTYYVRAWAENAAGISYGDLVSFKTYDGHVTDIDGNIYNTVIIGEQEWMVTNLKTTTLNDGTPIDKVSDLATWVAHEDPAYIWYEDYEEKFADVYGALYNFYTVETGDLCPDGWRVPLEADWEELIDYVGGQLVAGGQLMDTQYWKDLPETVTNDYRFSARPGGMRHNAEDFLHLTEQGFWWAYGYMPDVGPRFYWINYEFEDIVTNGLEENFGLSVRCVKGDPPKDPPLHIMN